VATSQVLTVALEIISCHHKVADAYKTRFLQFPVAHPNQIQQQLQISIPCQTEHQNT